MPALQWPLTIARRPGEALAGADLVATSLAMLRRQRRRLPRSNPFELFKQRLVADLDWLVEQPIEHFHQYFFATLRQFGSCYELAATYLKWLQAHDIAGLSEAINGLTAKSTGAKTLQFNLASALVRKKSLDLSVIDHRISWPADQFAERRLRSYRGDRARVRLGSHERTRSLCAPARRRMFRTRMMNHRTGLPATGTTTCWGYNVSTL